jgi:transposase
VDKIYVGIDVSKSALDVAFSNKAEIQSFPNQESGIKQIISYLKKQELTLTVMEATGGLEKLLAASLVEASIPVVVVNPRQVRDFVKAKGKLAKTDNIDARILVEFGSDIHPDIRALSDRQTDEIKAMLVRRQQIMDMITMENNRLWPADIRVIPSIQDHLNWLKRELKDLDNIKTLMNIVADIK